VLDEAKTWVDEMPEDPDLGERECLLVFLTGNLTARTVADKRAKVNERMKGFISQNERKRRKQERSVG
jgi:hypothetical protein